MVCICSFGNIMNYLSSENYVCQRMSLSEFSFRQEFHTFSYHLVLECMFQNRRTQSQVSLTLNMVP